MYYRTTHFGRQRNRKGVHLCQREVLCADTNESPANSHTRERMKTDIEKSSALHFLLQAHIGRSPLPRAHVSHPDGTPAVEAPEETPDSPHLPTAGSKKSPLISRWTSKSF